MVKINKKAMEMSLNLIIMLIIGMVILGLVIGFVNSLVGKGTESFNKELAKNEQAELSQIKSCPENLCISPYPTLTVKKGKDNPVYIKIRGYEGIVECKAGSNLVDSAGCESGNLNLVIVTSEGGTVTTGTFSLRGQLIKVTEGGEDAQRFILTTTTAAPGTYFATLTLTNVVTSPTPVSKAITIIVE